MVRKETGVRRKTEEEREEQEKNRNFGKEGEVEEQRWKSFQIHRRSRSARRGGARKRRQRGVKVGESGGGVETRGGGISSGGARNLGILVVAGRTIFVLIQ